MEMLVYEIKRLIEDYDKCPVLVIKDHILIDIELLKDALLILNNELDLEIPSDTVRKNYIF